MSNFPEAYDVECPQVSNVCGIYLLEKPLDHKKAESLYYKQVGGKHTLKMDNDDSWCVFSGDVCVCYALDKTVYPTGVKAWEYLHGKSYRAAPRMRVRIKSLDNRQPTTSRSNPCYVEKASDWETVEEWQGLLKTPIKYYKNKVTGAKQRSVPVVVARQETAASEMAKPMISQAGSEQQQEGSLKQEDPTTRILQTDLASDLSRQLQEDKSVSEQQKTNEVLTEQIKELESARSCQQILQTSLDKARERERELRVTIAQLEASISSLKAQLEEVDQFPVKECPPPLPPATATASTLSTTTDFALAKKHVLRDAPAEANNVFPCGTEIRAEFLLVSARIEAFAFDVMNCLEEIEHNHSAEFFVSQVMAPLYRVTQEYVMGLVETQREHLVELCGESARWVEGSEAGARSPHRQFFLATQQPLLPQRVEQLEEARIASFIAELGPTVGIVHDAMQAPTFQGLMEDGLRLNQLVRCMLRLHTLALLSDPLCHLLPPPGKRLVYQPLLHTEIMGPGVKRYGYIKEGEEVEVVFCGLCFRPADLEPPTLDPVEVSKVLGKGLDKPPALVPALVRRVVADGR